MSALEPESSVVARRVGDSPTVDSRFSGQTIDFTCLVLRWRWLSVRIIPGISKAFVKLIALASVRSLSLAGSRRVHRLPDKVFTSVGRFSRARSSNDLGRFVNAAGPGRNVPCPCRDRSCRENRRRHDGTSLRTRDVPPLCCVRLSSDFSLLAEQYRRCSSSLDSGRTECEQCS